MDNSPLYELNKILTMLFSSLDTGIVTVPVKIFLAGIPKTPVSRVAGAIFHAATDRDEKSSGSAWLLVDDGPVFVVPKDQFKQGVYKMIDDRANAGRAYVVSTIHYPIITTYFAHLTPSTGCTQGLKLGISLPVISGASRAMQSSLLVWERFWLRLLGIIGMR